MTTPTTADVVIWLGSAAPARTIRWLDGAIHAGAKLDRTKKTPPERIIALAAGPGPWLDLVADRARHAGIGSAGVQTDLVLDYMGWSQIAVGLARFFEAPTVIVDEASRPERWVELGPIADMLDAVTVSNVVKVSSDSDVIQATRVHRDQLQTMRVRGNAVIGVRIPSPPVDEYPTPLPSTTMKKLELDEIGLDYMVLSHRSLPRRAPLEPRKTVDRVAEHLLVHVRSRS
ncbi:MAG: hypothetical protein QM831_44555 [Kofleriaceae bacterium]